jgi:hypothetical protein
MYCLYAGWSMRVLYPDGTIFFTYILEHTIPVHWHWDRQFAYYVQHAPLITAIKLGITDVHSLARIHATWYFSFGWISLLTCYLSLPREHKIFIIFPMLWIFGVYIHVDFFPITPGRFITAIFWIVLFQIFFRSGWASWILVAAVAWPLLRSYQGMVILGPILSIFALLKAYLLVSANPANMSRVHGATELIPVDDESEIPGTGKTGASTALISDQTNASYHTYSRQSSAALAAVWFATALYFLAGAILSFISILDPQDKASFLTFILGFALFIDQHGYPSFSFLMGFSTLIMVVIRLMHPSGNTTLKTWFGNRTAFVFWVLMGLMTLVTALLWHNAMAPETHQQLRSLNIYGTALLSLVVFIAVTTQTTGPWPALRLHFLRLIAFSPASKDANHFPDIAKTSGITHGESIAGNTSESGKRENSTNNSVKSRLDGVMQAIGRLWQRGLPGLQHPSPQLTCIIAVLVVVQLIWAFSATHQWNRYLQILQNTLEEAPSGLVLAQDTPLTRLPEYACISNGFHNDWDAPLMSILFAPNPATIRTIIAHSYDNLYHPLDPRDLESLPDLSRYGFDLSAYIDAYHKQGPVVVPDMELPRFLKWLETQTTGINDFFERR